MALLVNRELQGTPYVKSRFLSKGGESMAIEYNKPLICPVVIGRVQDLTHFRLLVDRVKSGQGQVALLSGEAGIGKRGSVSRRTARTRTRLCLTSSVHILPVSPQPPCHTLCAH